MVSLKLKKYGTRICYATSETLAAAGLEILQPGPNANIYLLEAKPVDKPYIVKIRFGVDSRYPNRKVVFYNYFGHSDDLNNSKQTLGKADYHNEIIR
jgi:hypothetical protein